MVEMYGLNVNLFIFIQVVQIVIGQVIIESDFKRRQTIKFPATFSFGAATAAYQIEGGWNEDGKGPSIWDTLTHNHPELIADHSNADVGTDSYHFYERDIEALKEVGFQHYRFSISWSRIFPHSLKMNAKGFEYYRRLVDALIVNNIEPIATLHHYDLPQWIESEGGFLNEIVTNYFEIYADAVYRELGSVIKIWITFNEPMDVCVQGYDDGSSAPLVQKPGIGSYVCSYNVLKAHAKAFHLYKDKYFDDQGGMVGITLDGRFYYRKDEHVDPSVVDRALQFDIGWFAHPIFSAEGDFPEVMVRAIGERSKREGRNISRLPEMTEEMRKFMHKSADFLGFNYYSSRMIEMNSTDYDPKVTSNYYSDTRLIQSTKPEWKRAKSEWLYSVPNGLRDALKWFKSEYNNVPVIITENGWSDDGQLDDDGRIEYLKSHLQAISEAIDDGCNVLGYTAWSIIDNFEWMKGFTEHFGLFSVNLTSPNKERIAKKSAGFLKEIIASKSFVYT